MRTIAAVLLFALTGCATVVQNDLQAASARATAAGDAEGAACWNCYIKAGGNPAGVFDMIEATRLVRQCRPVCVDVVLP